MGQPKQLLPIGDRPLLRRVVETAIGTSVTPVIVVLGANATEIRPTLDGLPVHVIVNDNWEEGMGSSVRTGMETLVSLAPEMKNVIIALGDMPNFAGDHIARLMTARRQTGRSIIASRYGGKLMPPMLFADVHFPALLALRGDAGARALLQIHHDEVVAIPADELFDLDTQADYAAYLKQRTERSPGDGAKL